MARAPRAVGVRRPRLPLLLVLALALLCPAASFHVPTTGRSSSFAARTRLLRRQGQTSMAAGEPWHAIMLVGLVGGGRRRVRPCVHAPLPLPSRLAEQAVLRLNPPRHAHTQQAAAAAPPEDPVCWV